MREQELNISRQNEPAWYGKPAGLLEIWNEFAVWRENEMLGTPMVVRLFRTKMNGRWVWVIEDGAAFTLMYPEDY